MSGLIYGNVYHIQNGYNQWSGGFLDTRGSGCESNFLCVSTAAGFDRDNGSGSWQILPASGRVNGDPVRGNDLIYLLNQHGGNGGYLDACGAGCESNLLCVSTAKSQNRDNGSGTWRIFVDTIIDNEVNEQQTVHLLNGYNDFTGGFLDTRGSGCEGNQLCVSTNCGWNRESGSTLWRFFSHHDKFLAENYKSA